MDAGRLGGLDVVAIVWRWSWGADVGVSVLSVVTLKRGELAGWMGVVVIEDGKGGGLLGESAVVVAGLRRQRPCVTAQPHFGSRWVPDVASGCRG